MKIGVENKKSEIINIEKNIISSKVNYKNAINLVKSFSLPKLNNSVYFWIEGNFKFGDFIPVFICQNNLNVEELTIITLSADVKNFESFDELLYQNWVEKINLVLSGYFYRTEKIKHTRSYDYLEELSIKWKNKFNVFTLNTHQKICLIKTKNEKFVLHGSANLKGSQNFEQLMIDNSNELYDFNYKMFEQIKIK